MRTLKIVKPYVFGLFLATGAGVLLTMSYHRRLVQEGWIYQSFLLAAGLLLLLLLLEAGMVLHQHRKDGIFPRLGKKALHYAVIATVASFLLRNRLEWAFTLTLWAAMVLLWILTEGRILARGAKKDVSPSAAKK